MGLRRLTAKSPQHWGCKPQLQPLSLGLEAPATTILSRLEAPATTILSGLEAPATTILSGLEAPATLIHCNPRSLGDLAELLNRLVDQRP